MISKDISMNIKRENWKTYGNLRISVSILPVIVYQELEITSIVNMILFLTETPCRWYWVSDRTNLYASLANSKRSLKCKAKLNTRYISNCTKLTTSLKMLDIPQVFHGINSQMCLKKLNSDLQLINNAF